MTNYKKSIASGKRKHQPVIFVRDMGGNNVHMVVRDQNKRKELLDSNTNEFRTTTISTEGVSRRRSEQEQREQREQQQPTAEETSQSNKQE